MLATNAARGAHDLCVRRAALRTWIVAIHLCPASIDFAGDPPDVLADALTPWRQDLHNALTIEAGAS